MKNLFSPSEQGESADGAHHCCHGLQSCRDVSCPVAVEPAEADEDGTMVPSSFTHCVGRVKDNVVGRVSQGSRWLLPGDHRGSWYVPLGRTDVCSFALSHLPLFWVKSVFLGFISWYHYKGVDICMLIYPEMGQASMRKKCT